MFIAAVVAISSYTNRETPIGGETDEHGCMLMAGYTWNEEVGACIREWELNENQRQAAEIAVEYIGYTKGTTVLRVDVARCPGCFAVQLEKGRDRIDVTLENWKIIGRTLTPEECEAMDGRVLNIVGGVDCEDNETNVNNVTGFISPNVCCVPCAKEGESFSQVYEDYPEHCCEGLTEWHSGFDTRISIADECYDTGLAAGYPVGTCINCGNDICEDIETLCNCPEDCAGKNKSDYLTVGEFCQSTFWNQTISGACEEDIIKDSPICELC